MLMIEQTTVTKSEWETVQGIGTIEQDAAMVEVIKTTRNTTINYGKEPYAARLIANSAEKLD